MKTKRKLKFSEVDSKDETKSSSSVDGEELPVVGESSAKKKSKKEMKSKEESIGGSDDNDNNSGNNKGSKDEKSVDSEKSSDEKRDETIATKKAKKIKKQKKKIEGLHDEDHHSHKEIKVLKFGRSLRAEITRISGEPVIRLLRAEEANEAKGTQTADKESVFDIKADEWLELKRSVDQIDSLLTDDNNNV